MRPAAPVRIPVTPAEAAALASYEAGGVPCDCRIPFPDPGQWLWVMRNVRDGDEIVLYAGTRRRDVTEVCAVVIGLDLGTRSLQVIV